MRRISNLSIIFGLLFIVLPNIHWFGILDIYEFPKVLSFVGIMLINIGYIVAYLSNTWKINKVDILLLVFMLVAFISSLLGINFIQSFWGQYYRYQGLLTLLCYGIFYMLITRTDKMLKQAEMLQKIIFFGGILLSLIILSQAISSVLLHIAVYTYNDRFAGFLGNPNFAGAFLAISYVFSDFPLSKRISGWFLWPLFLLAGILTGSRTGIIGLLLGLLLICLQKLRKKYAYLIIVIASTVSVFLINFGIQRNSSFENRGIIYQRALTTFVQRPIFGWGLEHFSDAFQSTIKENEFDLQHIRVDKTHNEIMEVANATGLIGGMLYLLILGISLSVLYRYREIAFVRSNLYALLIFIFVSNLNVVNVNAYIFQYMAFGVAAHLMRTKKLKQ